MAEWNINNSMGDSLEHHGILGMHWGIRRFQPYPKGEKKGKEVGEAAKKPGVGTRALMAVGKAPTKAMNAIKTKYKESKKFDEDAVNFYKKHGTASKPKNSKLSDKRKTAIASSDYWGDRYLYGKKGIKRIMDKVDNKNKTLRQAKASEDVRYAGKIVAGIALSVGAVVTVAAVKSGYAERLAKTAFNRVSDTIKGGVGSILSDGTVKAAGRTLNSDLFLPLKKR